MTAQILALPADVPEFKSAIENYAKGAWSIDRWRTFRLRYGIYEQRQTGQFMVRSKVPGGRLSFSQARAMAASNTAHAGGDLHISTRQGMQFYDVKQDKLADLIGALNAGGVTTREASGNTFRAIVACPEAGFCKHQHTDAATVAERLTKAWLRNPLVQHMPRKFKTSVSGCERDCGLTHIDDLGFIATEQNGKKGFRIVAGGGLGIQPITAIQVFDFVEEVDLITVQEVLARLHIRHSTRTNKNKSRIKFLVKKFGAEKFVDLARQEFDHLKSLAAPAWEGLTWGAPVETGKNVFIEVPLGWLSSKQLTGLAEVAEGAGGTQLRLTRTQNIVALGIDHDQLENFITAVRNLGLDASGREHALKDLVVCPGTSTCAIGITDSHVLGESLLDAQAEFTGLKGVKVRVSGCHNSCSQHHIGDIGFHGVAKKIEGKPAPHYQIHLGGSPEQHGVLGPVLPVRFVKDALKLLLTDLGPALDQGQSVREWAENLGKDGLNALLAPVVGDDKLKAAKHIFDLGSDFEFVPPATSTGECAAGAVVAEFLTDLSQVARSDVLRSHTVGRHEDTVANLQKALRLPAQRLLVIAGEDKGVTKIESVFATIRNHWSHNAALQATFEAAVNAVTLAEKSTTAALQALPALATWQNVADAEVERILSSIPNTLAGAAE